METITAALRQYGLETVLVAIAINLCTALCKIPVKILARKAKDSARITRFIVFMPIAIGFVLTFCYAKWITRDAVSDKTFVQLWLTASSLSLTFYAVAEKLFPAKNKAEDKATAKASKELIETVAESLGVHAEEQTEVVQADKAQKIVLRGHKQDEVEK